MPKSRAVGLSPTCEDCALVLILDDDIVLGKKDGESRVTNRANADECLLEAWHDVASLGEFSWEIRDAVPGRGTGLLTMASSRAHGDGWRGWIEVRDGCVFRKVDGSGTCIRDAGSSGAGASGSPVGNLALLLGDFVVDDRLRGGTTARFN